MTVWRRFIAWLRGLAGPEPASTPPNALVLFRGRIVDQSSLKWSPPGPSQGLRYPEWTDEPPAWLNDQPLIDEERDPLTEFAKSTGPSRFEDGT